jgi:hypothetical protein
MLRKTIRVVAAEEKFEVVENFVEAERVIGVGTCSLAADDRVLSII